MRATRLSAGRHAGVDNGWIASPAFDDPAVTQLTLPGFEATPQLPAHRLFLAIKPDAETAGRIARLIEQLRPVVGFKGKALRTERLHVTLHHLGDFVHLPAHTRHRVEWTDPAVPTVWLAVYYRPS